MKYQIESFFLRIPVGLKSRIKVLFYKTIGMQLGINNRFENGLVRRATQIRIGNYNTFSSIYKLWPDDSKLDDLRISIGDRNYFNKNVMIDACGNIEIGNGNMFGPDVYITDSNHTFGKNISPKDAAMNIGSVRIGNHCWIGAKAIILKDVELGDYCVVGAGAVVTKSFPAHSVIAGVPAKILSNISNL